jgi:hypothetical protein
MKILIRRNQPYASVILSDGENEIDLGTLDAAERVSLARQLADAAHDLLWLTACEKQREVLADIVNEL